MVDNKHLDPFDPETLNARWVKASFQANLNPHTVHTIQGLGALEIELEAEEFKLSRVMNDKGVETKDHAIPLSRLLNLSRLWLLGAYEIVRLIDQRLRELDIENPATLRLKDYKKTIARYRMPLAKLERQGKPYEELIAWPFTFGSGEVGWQIDHEAYSRKMLAYELLVALEHLRKSNTHI